MVDPVSLTQYRAHRAGRALFSFFGRERRAAESLSDVFPYIGVCNAPDAREMTQKLAARGIVDFVSDDDDRVELPNPTTDLLKGVPISSEFQASAGFGRLWVVRIRLVEPFRFIGENCKVGCLQPVALLCYCSQGPLCYTAPH